MLTSDLVFCSIPHFVFVTLFFAFQLCFEQVLYNSTLGGGWCSTWMLPFTSWAQDVSRWLSAAPKVTFELIFSWLGKLLPCFVFPEEMTEFMVKDMHSAGIHREGITVLQAELTLRLCSGKLCGCTPGDAVEWCESKKYSLYPPVFRPASSMLRIYRVLSLVWFFFPRCVLLLC